MVMEEEELTDEKLLAAVHKLYDSREDFINAMNQSSQQDPIKTIIGLIEDATSNNFLTTVIYIVQKQVPERHLFSLHIHRCYFV